MPDADYFRSRIPEFVETQRKFFAGEIGAKEFKKVSGGFGCVAQRGGGLAMVRLRMCGGRMDPDKLDFIIGQCEEHGLDWVHTTTCECVQLHNLSGDAAAEVIEKALDHGIFTQGAGGDFPRNVSATSLSGIEPGEDFDVYPYAKATESYLLDLMREVRLPGKLKVAFSSSRRNETHATFRDLGFVSRPDGRFDVWSAGGLGAEPSMGVPMAEGVDPSEVLYHVRAMVDNFMEHGNREDRSRARTRHLRADMGDDRYREGYLKHLEALKEAGGLDIRPEAPVYSPKPFKEVPAGLPRVFRQKQDGLYYVTYRPVAGDVPVEMLRRIRGAIEGVEGAELRVSPDSAIHVANLDGEEAVRVARATEGGADTVFESSVSCIGATICQLGLRDSNGTLKSMVSAVREAGIPADALPRFRISGCRSSCGCHQVGVVGLRGASRRVGEDNVDVYEVSVNGCGLQGRERFGDGIGAVPVDRVADMAVFLGRTVAASGKGFDEWYSGEGSDLAEVLSGFLLPSGGPARRPEPAVLDAVRQEAHADDQRHRSEHAVHVGYAAARHVVQQDDADQGYGELAQVEERREPAHDLAGRGRGALHGQRRGHRRGDHPHAHPPAEYRHDGHPHRREEHQGRQPRAHHHEPHGHGHVRAHVLGDPAEVRREARVGYPGHPQQEADQRRGDVAGGLRILEERRQLGRYHEEYDLRQEHHRVADDDEAVVRLPRRPRRAHRLPGRRLPHREYAQQEDRYPDEVDHERDVPAELREHPPRGLQDERPQPLGGDLVTEHLRPVHAGVVLCDEGRDGRRQPADADADEEPHHQDERQIVEEVADEAGRGEDQEGGHEGPHLAEAVRDRAQEQSRDAHGQRREGDDQRDDEVRRFGEALGDQREGRRDCRPAHQREHRRQEDGYERDLRRREPHTRVPRRHGRCKVSMLIRKTVAGRRLATAPAPAGPGPPSRAARRPPLQPRTSRCRS